jgi:alpha-glucosidase (family GH31 glycosyl hydrolase)
MSRPVDCLLDGTTKVCTPFSPKDVMASGWVGDDDATMVGMTGCLRKVIYSAWSGYGSMGCDIGGYRGGWDTKDRETFLRWAQLGSFLPLMENGGGGEHRPWMYDTEVTDIYRKYTIQHHRLATYLHNNGANAIDAGVSAIHPVDDQTFPIDKSLHIVYPQPSTFSYRLGNDLLIHPVIHNAANESDRNTIEMIFPEEKDGSSVVWLDWWEPNNMKKAHKSGEKAIRFVELDEYAVYVKEGSLLPLHDTNKEDSETELVNMDRYTFTWFHPQTSATKESPAIYEMRESMTTGTGIRATTYFTSSTSILSEITDHPGSVAFDLVGVEKPEDVQIEAFHTAGCRHSYDFMTKRARVQCKNNIGGVRIQFSGIKLTSE